MVHPHHPLFGVPKEQLKMWRDENIDGNKYGDVHCRQIIQAMATVLYQQHGFSGNNSAYYYMPENIFINEVHNEIKCVSLKNTALRGIIK